jgi:hypothetical protein
VQINKPGLSLLMGKLSGILQNAVNLGEIESFVISFPILNALAKDASSRSTTEEAMVASARTSRSVNGDISIEFSGVLHTINLDVNITV